MANAIKGKPRVCPEYANGVSIPVWSCPILARYCPKLQNSESFVQKALQTISSCPILAKRKAPNLG